MQMTKTVEYAFNHLIQELKQNGEAEIDFYDTHIYIEYEDADNCAVVVVTYADETEETDIINNQFELLDILVEIEDSQKFFQKSIDKRKTICYGISTAKQK